VISPKVVVTWIVQNEKGDPRIEKQETRGASPTKFGKASGRAFRSLLTVQTPVRKGGGGGDLEKSGELQNDSEECFFTPQGMKKDSLLQGVRGGYSYGRSR